MSKSKEKLVVSKFGGISKAAVVGESLAAAWMGTKNLAESDSKEGLRLELRKPSNLTLFRVHPSIFSIYVFEQKAGAQTEYFLVVPAVAPKLDYVKEKWFYLCTTQDNKPFVWLIGKGTDTYSESARGVALRATRTWLRLVSDTTNGIYKGREAKDRKQEPNFQGLDKLSEPQLLHRAFDSDHLILSMSHPVAKEISANED
jgi:hypothetical protein